MWFGWREDRQETERNSKTAVENILRKRPFSGPSVEKRRRRTKWKEKIQNVQYVCTLYAVLSTRFLLFYLVSRTRDWELLKATKGDICVYRRVEGKYEKTTRKWKKSRRSLTSLEREGIVISTCLSVASFFVQSFASPVPLSTKTREKALKAPCVSASWTFCDIPFVTLYSKEDRNVPSSLLSNIDETVCLIYRITLLEEILFLLPF